MSMLRVQIRIIQDMHVPIVILVSGGLVVGTNPKYRPSCIIVIICSKLIGKLFCVLN